MTTYRRQRTAASPAYYLGRSADTWRFGLDRRRRGVERSNQT
jgi:hypothetical protein